MGVWAAPEKAHKGSASSRGEKQVEAQESKKRFCLISRRCFVCSATCVFISSLFVMWCFGPRLQFDSS